VKKKKAAAAMSLQQADAHQRKHGFKPLIEVLVPGFKSQTKTTKLRVAREMNATEREFSFLLEAQKQKGEIVRWVFEGVTLRWGDGMHYKPDFFIVVATGIKLNDQRIGHWRCIEVKGKKIWDRDIVRFKGCKAEWPEFEFEMHQKLDGKWNRLL
jgi:hypothetical protein